LFLIFNAQLNLIFGITPERSQLSAPTEVNQMNDDITYLRETIKTSHESRSSGNHPFGALIFDAKGEVIAISGNTYVTDKGTGHAELNVARAAAAQFPTEFLEKCTLVTSVEPCCMCAGAIYWAGIGSLVYGLTEKRLAELTGDNPENLTMDMPCRQVLAAGQRSMIIRGPFPELEEEIVSAHHGFW
jgi:tRNA(Arg) A34 adenosine deaminase TadA